MIETNMQREYEIGELGGVVKEFLTSLPTPSNGGALVLGFSGNLGAGKTTFTKEMLCQLGHAGNVPSPTFVLRRDYVVGESKVIHIDAYRLEKPEHIYQVVSEEELGDKNNLIIIEWPEKSADIFDAIYLFEHVDENVRRISKR